MPKKIGSVTLQERLENDEARLTQDENAWLKLLSQVGDMARMLCLLRIHSKAQDLHIKTLQRRLEYIEQREKARERQLRRA